MDIQVYVCAGRCGKELHVTELDGSGWSCLDILGKYRCPECERTLSRMSSLPGSLNRNDIDSLPKDSIGALKKMPEHRILHEKPR